MTPDDVIPADSAAAPTPESPDDERLDSALLEAAEREVQQADAVPVCLHCCLPVSPLDHRCPHCQRVVGQYTPNLPYEGIFFEVEFLGALWQRAVGPESRALWRRGMDLLIVVWLAPIMLVGILFLGRRQP